MKHKWHKEIKAWADGAKIEYRKKTGYGCIALDWVGIGEQESIDWSIDQFEFRIKPQPQYLYVYLEPSGKYTFGKFNCQYNGTHPIGKIKLEQDDE